MLVKLECRLVMPAVSHPVISIQHRHSIDAVHFIGELYTAEHGLGVSSISCVLDPHESDVPHFIRSQMVVFMAAILYEEMARTGSVPSFPKRHRGNTFHALFTLTLSQMSLTKSERASTANSSTQKR
jgi:hypothetical protein